MTEVAVAALCIFSGLIGAFIAWSVTNQPLGSIIRDRIRRPVVVTLKTAETYRGVLYEADPHAIVLRSTFLLNPDGSRVSVDGEVLILRGDIAYVQML